MIEALFVFFVDRVQVLAASEMPGPGDSGPRATTRRWNSAVRFVNVLYFAAFCIEEL